MKWKDLHTLGYDQSGNINIPALQDSLPDTPLEVHEDLLSGFGKNDDFLELYGDIDLSKIKWEKHKLRAKELVECSYYNKYSDWLEGMSERMDNYSTLGWDCLHHTEKVMNYWKNNSTWYRRPIFFDFDPSSISQEKCLRLLEGHTRIGILKGALKNNILDKNSEHEIWLGKLLGGHN